jgi:hypothetical protein
MNQKGSLVHKSILLFIPFDAFTRESRTPCRQQPQVFEFNVLLPHSLSLSPFISHPTMKDLIEQGVDQMLVHLKLETESKENILP